ncbi:MAG: DNA primase [Thermoplasmata archaeon]|nr:MAG: DNA primase [Thermoplasmata archaeon]
MSIDPSSAKYLIKAKIKADGAVEKSDVIGAIFGQTEGLMGEELDLRDLQKSARIGRIEVDIVQKKGKSEGTLTLTSALEKVETAIVAAGIESVDRIGPCKAEITIEKVEDIRVAKRRNVIERAKEILTDMIKESREELEDIAEAIRQSVQVEEIVYYGKDHLPAGPNVEKSDAVIIVEGRNDVLNLLKHGIKNAIAVDGTNIPQTIIDLCNEKIATAFVDGDRGGELILRELLQVADIDFVARAPKTREVEEISYKLIMKALKNKVPAEQYMENYGLLKKEKEEGGGELSEEELAYKKFLLEAKENHSAIFLNNKREEIERVKVDSLVDELQKTKAKVHTIIFDGIITQRLLDVAFEQGAKVIISPKLGEVTKIPKAISIITQETNPNIFE